MRPINERDEPNITNAPPANGPAQRVVEVAAGVVIVALYVVLVTRGAVVVQLWR